MFKRNVVVVALTAVVLMGAFLLGRGGGTIIKHRNKPKAAVENAIAAVIPNIQGAGFANLMPQASNITADKQQLAFGDRKKIHRPRATIEPTKQQMAFGDRKKIHRPRASIEPNNGQLLVRLVKPRHPRKF